MICFRIACLLLATSRQTAPPPDPARQLDFWVGEWQLTGRQRVAPDKDEWQETPATNTIRSVLKGNVIEENFEMKGFQGRSVSVYDRRTKLWKQTWVDDQGSYLDFTGGWSDGRMTLSRRVTVNGQTVMQHMVFHDIKPDSLVWDWEVSRDEGKTWKLMWQLNYRRKALPASKAKKDLDFWVGRWNVKDMAGKAVGFNRIERILDGSAVVEHWRDAKGGEGKSFFYYLPLQDRWKQVWVTPQGVVKEKLSEPVENGIRFSGQVFLPNGKAVPDRTTLTRLSDGSVKQVIEVSRDNGSTWQPTWEAIYKRKR